MRATDGLALGPLTSSNDDIPFELDGGLYGIDYSATWGGGSATLSKLAADGVTYVTAATAFSANGYVSVYLPKGTYRITVATATAVYIGINRIPGE